MSATGGDAISAHAAYCAALDREEAATSDYAERLGRLGDVLPSSEQVKGGRRGDQVLPKPVNDFVGFPLEPLTIAEHAALVAANA